MLAKRKLLRKSVPREIGWCTVAVKVQQHAGVAQRVRLHPLQIEELGDTFVVRLQQLPVDVRLDDRVLADRHEARSGEKVDLKGQAEHPPDTESAAAADRLLEQPPADAGATDRGR